MHCRLLGCKVSYLDVFLSVTQVWVISSDESVILSLRSSIRGSSFGRRAASNRQYLVGCHMWSGPLKRRSSRCFHDGVCRPVGLFCSKFFVNLPLGVLDRCDYRVFISVCEMLLPLSQSLSKRVTGNCFMVCGALMQALLCSRRVCLGD